MAKRLYRKHRIQFCLPTDVQDTLENVAEAVAILRKRSGLRVLREVDDRLLRRVWPLACACLMTRLPADSLPRTGLGKIDYGKLGAVTK